MLKCCLLAHGKAETEALTHCGVRVGGIQRGPSKAGGLWRSLVMLEGNPLEQLLTQSQPAWSRPAYGVSQVVVHLWMSITFSARTRLCRKSQRWNLCPDFHAGPRACRSQRAWFRFFSRASAASVVSGVYPVHFGMASAYPGREQGCSASFYLPKRLGALTIKVVMASRAPWLWLN